MADLVMAIDQGTTRTTVLVIAGDGRVIGRAGREITQYYPNPGWVEHDPEELFQSVLEVARRALRSARASAADVAAIGIANQRETAVVWERHSGKPVGRAIVWQCRRSAEICRRLKPHEAEIIHRTGLVLDPYFPATKLKWLMDREPALRRRAARGELSFGTVESWLIYRLSGGQVHVSDYTNASRTMLLNLRTRQWDPVMLRLFGVPGEMLPQLAPSRGPLAETRPGMIGPRSIPIGAAIGDQQAALFGQGAIRAGAAKVTYGTGAFLLMQTGQHLVRSPSRLLTTIALGPSGEPAGALEGAIFIAGAVVQWLRDGLKIIRRAADSAKLASLGAKDGRTYFVPAFVGLGAPYWDSDARGAIMGLTRGSSVADIVRAALEGIAFQVCDVLRAMERDSGRRVAHLKADGGAAANDYLLQFQADMLGRPVWRAASLEATAMGAAILAGMACGVWRSPADLAATRGQEQRFTPRMGPARRQSLLEGWHDAVRRVLTVQ